VLISVAWGLLIEILNWKVFLRLASALNRWENHRTTLEFEKQLVGKLVAFFLLDGFLWCRRRALWLMELGGASSWVGTPQVLPARLSAHPLWPPASRHARHRRERELRRRAVDAGA
jgi:hypothetical protein